MRLSQRLIHASTDCVFSGRHGRYRVDDERDAKDVYGLSKILGEQIAANGRCTVIRCSVVGPEVNGSYGLMGWFLRQHGAVEGYLNHLWNGITTLEWAKVCSEVISGQYGQYAAILQPGIEPSLSKCELLGLIRRVWEKIEIKPVNAPESINRTLVPTSLRRPFCEQLTELKTWWRL
jgi:dTDP-4-dehydrorhamnose reductase